MRVGLVLPQGGVDGGGSWARISALARQAEAGGADSLWVCDHFFHESEDGSRVGMHEAWTLLSGLAAITERVALGTLVVATSFRSAGLLAKMAATADEVAGGRLILGIGCGWHEPEYRAFGYPFDHRVGRFEETVAILAPLLRGERVSFEGRWMRVEGAELLPPPTRQVPILIAATGDRMLALTARYAQAWQEAWFGRPDARFRETRDRFLAACEAEGRDPATIEVTVGVDVDERDASGQLVEATLPLDAEGIADGLAAWAEEGVDHVQLGVHPMTPAGFEVALEGMRRFRDA